MDPVKSHDPSVVADQAKRVSERHGGLIVSLAFHMALFTLLYNVSVPEIFISEPEPQPIRILLAEPAPEEVGEEEQPQPPQPEELLTPQPPLPVQRTVAELIDSTSEDNEATAPLELEPVAAMFSSEEIENLETELVQIDEVEPPEEDADRRIEEELEFEQSLRPQLAALSRSNDELSQSGSSEIDDLLRTARVDQKAMEWLSTTDGLDKGVIRSIDVSDHPPELARSVLARYGIETTVARLDGKGSSYGFLNRAKTSAGTFYNRAGKGVYRVFSIPQALIPELVRMEVDALRRRGMDPARTRVLRVDYGIVNTTRGYALGVKDLEVAPMEFDTD